MASISETLRSVLKEVPTLQDEIEGYKSFLESTPQRIIISRTQESVHCESVPGEALC